MDIFGKNVAKKVAGPKGCPGCGMPATDPAWLVCPRCRTPLQGCGGCADCGRCADKTGR